MTARDTSSVYRPGIHAILQEHEQKSAWLFFTVMSYLLMSYAPQTGTFYAGDIATPLSMLEWNIGLLWGYGHHTLLLALHSILIGFWLLYCLKTAALFVRRSTAWAITGLMFLFCPEFCCKAAELPMVMQTVCMYHVLIWARGKRERFCPRHFFMLGVGISVALLTTLSQVVFWLPLLALMLWVNKGERLKSIAFTIAGLPVPFVCCLPYAAGIPAHIEWRLAELGGGIAGSLLLTDPLRIFNCVLPRFSQAFFPGAPALIPGHILLFMWMRPFRRIHPGRKVAINATLGTAFALCFWLCFCTSATMPQYTLPALGFNYFIPFVLVSLTGSILVVRRWILNRRAKRVLRGIGLMIPFITLVILLLIPVIRTAMGQ